MSTRHKNKTLATFCATLLGSMGVHRFYLYGIRDFAGWTYLGATLLYATVVFGAWLQGALGTSVLVLFPIPVFIAFIEALVIGVTVDEKWDARHNTYSSRQSLSGWPVVVLLVLTLGGGFVAFITCLARATDLLYTGGAFG